MRRNERTKYRSNFAKPNRANMHCMPTESYNVTADMMETKSDLLAAGVGKINHNPGNLVLFFALADRRKYSRSSYSVIDH